MAKQLKQNPITLADLNEYLDGGSDFAFEVKILNSLIKLGFSCEHSGSYEDRATRKFREFDIRATKRFGKKFMRLAVECKNVRDNFPVLISCLPRRDQESFHEMIVSVEPNKVPLESRGIGFVSAMAMHWRNVRMLDAHSLYVARDPVGKSCDQVGRMPSGALQGGDSGVHEKWSQALSSADDLILHSTRDGSRRTGDIAFSLVLPIIVVPDGRLWTAKYDADGNRIGDAAGTDRCSYFVDAKYSHQQNIVQGSFTISHLEFVTETGLQTLIGQLCGDEDALEWTFPAEEIAKLVAIPVRK